MNIHKIWALAKQTVGNEGYSVCVTTSYDIEKHAVLALKQYAEVYLERSRVVTWDFDIYTKVYTSNLLHDYKTGTKFQYLLFRVTDFGKHLFDYIDEKEFGRLRGIVENATNKPFQLKQIDGNRFAAILNFNGDVPNKDDWKLLCQAIVKALGDHDYQVVPQSNWLTYVGGDIKPYTGSNMAGTVHNARESNGVFPHGTFEFTLKNIDHKEVRTWLL